MFLVQSMEVPLNDGMLKGKMKEKMSQVNGTRNMFPPLFPSCPICCSQCSEVSCTQKGYMVYYIMSYNDKVVIRNRHYICIGHYFTGELCGIQGCQLSYGQWSVLTIY